MKKPLPRNPEWVSRGKTIKQLIEELKTFDDETMMVEISLDDGVTSHPISLVKKKQQKCLLVNSALPD